MSVQFWISGSNGVTGPFDAQQIRGLAQGGQLTPDMDISKDGVAWNNAGKIKGLFPPPKPPEIDDFAAVAPTAVPVHMQPATPPVSAARPSAPISPSIPSAPRQQGDYRIDGNRNDPGLLSRLINLKTFWFWFLATATYGIYVVVWLYRNSRIIEQVTNTKIVGDKYILWMAFLIACMVGNQTEAANAISHPTAQNMSALKVGGIANIAFVVMVIVWAYKAKNALESYVREQLGIHWQLNSAWTFFLSVFYINYCINDLPDAYRKLGGKGLP